MRNRKTVRVKWNDYSNGFYFITAVTLNRRHYFGEILNDEMDFSEIGDYTKRQIEEISTHHPYAKICSFVVMPNHIHLIINIDPTLVPSEKRNLDRINTNQPSRKEAANAQGWVSVVIGGLKSSITRFAHQKNIEFDWQPRFHEHIIQNNHQLEYIHSYITMNVVKWADDCFHPDNDKIK